MMKFVFTLYAILFMLCSSGWAAENQILVINSDRSIQQYAQAESSFKPVNADIIDSINLHGHWNDDDDIAFQLEDTQADIIYCIGSPAYMLAQRYASGKKIFFSSAVSVTSATLDDHSFGVASDLPPESLLTTYRFFFPTLKKLGLLYSEKLPESRLNEIKQHAADVNIHLIAVMVKHEGDDSATVSALNTLLPQIDALMLIPDPGVLRDRKTIEMLFRSAHAASKPVFAYRDIFLHFGATLVVSSDTETIGKQVTSLLKRVVDGELSSSIIEPPAASHIILNHGQAKKYGFQVRAMAIPTAQQVIQ